MKDVITVEKKLKQLKILQGRRQKIKVSRFIGILLGSLGIHNLLRFTKRNTQIVISLVGGFYCGLSVVAIGVNRRNYDTNW